MMLKSDGKGQAWLLQPCQPRSSLKRELRRQPADQDFEVARLKRRLVVRADKREVFAAQTEVERAALARLKVDLAEAAHATPRRRERGDEIARGEEDGLPSGGAPRVLQRHADGHLAFSLHRRRAETKVAVGEGGVAEALAELELRARGEVAEGCVFVLERLAVVVEEVVDGARGGEGKTTAGVEVAEEHVGDRRAAFVRRV